MDPEFRLPRLWPWLGLIVVATMLGAGAAFLVGEGLPKTYTSEAKLLVGQSLTDPPPDYTQLLAAQILARNYVDLATTKSILTGVAERLGLAADNNLASRVRPRSSNVSTLVVIAADGDTSQAAADLANAVASELVKTSVSTDPATVALTQQMRDDVMAIGQEIESLRATVADLTKRNPRTALEDRQLTTALDRLGSLRSTRATLLSAVGQASTVQVTLVDDAVAGTSGSSLRSLINAGLGGALGLGVALVVGMAFASRSARSRESRAGTTDSADPPSA